MAEHELELSEANQSEEIGKMVVALRPKWKSVSDRMRVECVRGGITNRLMACFLKENGINSSETVLFRIYGANTETFISHEDEIKNMVLVKKYELGPAFYGKFKNGIFYEYLPGGILEQKMLANPDMYERVAKAIASLHLVNFTGFKTESELGPAESIFIFTKIVQLLNLVHDDYKDNMEKMTERLFGLIPSKLQLVAELAFLQDNLTKFTNKHRSLIVFSHNDLLLGNLIYNQKAQTVKFIDFEYAEQNYQAYDIANHFNEYAGVDKPNYSYFPDKEYQLKWLKVYLQAFYEKAGKESGKKVVVDDKMVTRFYVEVNKFTMASHFMWAVWSLVQAQVSKLEFDFVEYANIRFKQYFVQKDAWASPQNGCDIY